MGLKEDEYDFLGSLGEELPFQRPYDPPYRRFQQPVIRATKSLVPTMVRAESSAYVPFNQDDPWRLFRGDFLYLECDGLLIEEMVVGNVRQPIGRYTPARYFNETRASAEKLAHAVEVLHGTPLSVAYEEQRKLVDDLVTEALGQSAKYRGRPVELNTQEVGTIIQLTLVNPTKHDIWARGTLEGKAVP